MNTDDNNIEEDSFSEGDSIVKIQTQHFSDYAGLVVSELPEKYRIAVHLADIEGLSMPVFETTRMAIKSLQAMQWYARIRDRMQPDPRLPDADHLN